MAVRSITSTFAGDRNQGLQVGYNSGSIESHFHAPPERPETPPQPSCYVPFRRDPDFVDRAALLDQIHERCSAPASRVALVGLGGVGKSQLAIEYCHRTAKRSPKTWVLWAFASNMARLEQSFREIAELVKIRGRKDPQVNVFKLVHEWLRDERNGPWILVLDNADDGAVLSPRTPDDQATQSTDKGNSSGSLQQHLSRYLPPTSQGSVLVTSRTRRAAMQLVEASDIILIEPMDNDAAYALLSRKLGENDAAGTDDSIAELATALDYMPLALVQAAAYIRQRAPRCSVQQYLEEYRRSDSRKTSLLNQGAGHLRRDEAANNAILLTWQLSFDHVRSTRQSATKLLSLMSFFDRQGIPERLLRSQNSTASEHTQAFELDDGFEDDLSMLRDYSFVTTTTDKKTFEMHSLVQLATREWLESQEQLGEWREKFISNLCAEFPTGNYENWDTCQVLFPHVKAALKQQPISQRSLKEWALLLYNAGWYAWQRGRADEAEYLSVLSTKVRTELLGEESLDTLKSMNMVGLAKELQGKFEEGEVIHMQTLAVREKVLGPEHPDTLISMNNLAGVLERQSKYEAAEVMHRQTLAMREKVLGCEHLDTLISINNLALILSRRGNHKEAEVMYRQMLVIREKVLGREHPDTLISMNNLAGVLQRQSKYEAAEVMHRQTLAMREKVLGCEHLNTLTSVLNLAYLLTERGCLNESLALHDRAWHGLIAVLGKEHPTTRICYENRSRALVLQEQSGMLPSQARTETIASEHSGNMSRFSRGLAKFGIRASSHSKG